MCSSVARDIPERGVFISVELCVAVLLGHPRDIPEMGVLAVSARDIPERGSVELCVAVLLGTSQRGECLCLLNCV